MTSAQFRHYQALVYAVVNRTCKVMGTTAHYAEVPQTTVIVKLWINMGSCAHKLCISELSPNFYSSVKVHLSAHTGLQALGIGM